MQPTLPEKEASLQPNRIKPAGRGMLARNLVVLAGGEALTRLMTFLAFVHLARVLEPAAYGLVELTLAVMMFFTLVAELGFKTLGTRDIALGPPDEGAVVRQVVSAQLCLALISFALLVGFALVLPINADLRVLLLGFGVSLLGVPFLLHWFFQGKNQMVRVTIPQVVRYAVFSLVVVILIRSRDHLRLLPLAELAAIAAAVGLNYWLFRKYGGRGLLRPSTGLSGELFRRSAPIGGSQIIWVLRMYLPTVILGLIAAQATVGSYGAAHRIMMIFQTVLAVYMTNIFPTASQLGQESLGGMARFLNRSLLLVVCPSIVLALVFMAVAPHVVALVYGQSFVETPSAAVLAILIWVIPILGWRGHSRNALLALGRQREELRCSLSGIGILAVLVLPMTWLQGGAGLAWAMVISEFVAALLTWIRYRQAVPEAAWWRRPPVASLLAGPTQHQGTRLVPAVEGRHE